MTSSPFTIERFWSVATPGTTLCLLDGTYRGNANMITPPPGLSGTQRAPIEVRALHDGKVLIDGEFVRRTIHLSNNSWFVIEGINAKQSADQLVLLSNGSNHNVLRRFIVWDVAIGKNKSGVVFDGSSDNLIEDCGIFGTFRKGIAPYRPASNNVARRCWVRWEGSITVGPKMGVTMVYDKTSGISFGTVLENTLVTWSGESMPESYTTTDTSGNPRPPSDPHYGVFSNFGVQNPAGLLNRDGGIFCTQNKVFGSLFYLSATDRYPIQNMVAEPGNQCVTMRHSMAVISPANPNFSRRRGFSMGGANNVASNLTSIAGISNTFVGYSLSNTSFGTSLASVANPWTTTGAGANLCRRWVNGQATSEPLWPWPMNDRIKATTASAGAYSGPCPTCVGGRQVRKATDVTADVERLLGPIPAQCRR